MNHCSGAFGSSMSQHSCIGCQGTSHESASSHFVGGTGTTYVTPRVFDTMSNHTYPPHDPSYHQPTHNSTYPPPYYPSYPHPHCFTQTLYPHSTPPTYCYEHQTPIQSSCKRGGSTILSEQHLDGLTHHYGFDNLTRQSVFLADGSEHSFYALPEDYPLEQATPPMSPPAGKNVGVKVAPSVAAQAAGLAPVLCSQANSTAGSELFVPNLQQPMNVQDASSVFKETPVYDICEKDSFCLNTTSDELVFSLELQQQEEERAYNCSDLKVSDSVVTGSSQLSIEHSKRESRLLWDPGASASLHSNKSKPPEELSYVAIVFPKVLATCNQVGYYVQQLTDQLSNVLVESHGIQFLWDPGILRCSIFSAQHILESSMKNDNIFSTGRILPWNPWYAIFSLLQSMWEFSLEKGRKLQWDPGIELLLYDLLWLKTLSKGTEYAMRQLLAVKFGIQNSTYFIDTAASLCCSPTYLIHQGRNVAIVLHFWRSIFNDMHYSQIFQKCNAINSLFHWHQYIQFNGIALWLITFNPP